MTAVFVSGALANRPDNGGGASVRMTWVSGLRRLGFDVWFVEQVERRLLTPGWGGNGTGRLRPEESWPARYFRQVTRRGGLAARSALLDERGEPICGAGRAALAEAASGAALLVNLGGHLRAPWLFERFARRAFVDLDPGYTQCWHAAGLLGSRLAGHDHFFTVGLNVGRPSCPIPVNGVRWTPLPPPVVLDEWPLEEGGLDAFTTVASWRGPFGPLAHGARRYGPKAHAFREFAELPRRVPARMEIALDIHPADEADRLALREHGWVLVDPAAVAASPDSYRRYVSHSGAEFSVAKGVYVETRSGWISDRTARYLAAGRPALVQDTGLSEHFPAGGGLIPFRTPQEAVAGAEAIAGDYRAHRSWARRLAEEHFDSDRVLGRFLDRMEVG